MALTDAWLKANDGKEREKVEEVTDRDSMSVRVSAKGKIVFQMRYRFGGKAKRMDLGTYPLMSLKQARDELQKHRAILDQGLDPKTEQDVARQKIVGAATFKGLFDDWYNGYCVENKESHEQIYRSFELHVFPELGHLPAGRITLQQWLGILEPLTKKAKGIADRVLVNTKQCLKWGVKRKIIETNVLADIYAKEDLGITKNRGKRVLSDDELVLFFKAVNQSRMTPKNKAFIKLCLAYGSRNSEVRDSEKSHYDLVKGVWTTPPENHKVGKISGLPLLRPILPYTKKIIEEAMLFSESNKWLFTKDGDTELMTKSSSLSLPYNVMQWCRRHCGVNMPHWSLHDLRRTARTNFSPITTYEIAEIMVGHIIDNNSETYDHYDYLPEQAAAYSKWFEKLERLEAQAALD